MYLLPQYAKRRTDDDISFLLNTVQHANALDLLARLPDGSVDLIATDPPYFKVKNLFWDKQWDKPETFIDWLKIVLSEYKRVLKPNGSLYIFASPQMSARVEIAVSEYFNVLNNIRWVKDAGWHQKTRKEDLRSYLMPWETCVFAEQYSANHEYATLEYELNGYVFKPLKDWFRGRATLYSIGLKDLNRALGAATNGGGLASGYFGDKCEFQIPTLERYTQMQAAYPEAFNREYEDLRREYEDLRRPFNASRNRPYTDVWQFKTVSSYPGKHPTEKPLDMMKHIVQTSSREGDIVLDTFCGSGTTLDAARQLKRQFIGCDMQSKWVESATNRINTPYELSLFDSA